MWDDAPVAIIGGTLYKTADPNNIRFFLNTRETIPYINMFPERNLTLYEVKFELRLV